jgi:hypothetical protein
VRRFAIIAGVWLLSLAVAFVAGLSRRPPPVGELVKQETHATGEAQRAAVQETARETHQARKVTTTTTTTRPTKAGPVPVRIVRVEEVATDTHEAGELHDVEHHQVVTEARTAAESRPEGTSAGWRLSATAGWALSSPSLRPSLYGAELSRRMLGPVWLGAWARTDGSAGLSLAVEW